VSATALVVEEVRRSPAIPSVYRTESRKLATQLSTRLLALACLLGPFAFALVLKIQSGTPGDTLFGVWVHSSGFAIALVVLGFAGSWGFPVMAGVLAGDIFSSEDRYGTWKTVLTRSCTRKDLFAGKLAAAATFAIGLVALTAVSSILAGVIFSGAHELVGLSGNVLSTGRALTLVIVSWVLSIAPMLAFVSLAVLFSIASRSGIVGVLGPSVVALAMQLLALGGSGTWVHMLLIASAFGLWHPLFVGHPFYGPLLLGLAVSIVWIAACITASWWILRRRDFAGAPETRRPGWATALKLAVATAVLIAFLAIAANWGPAGITPTRLKNAITPTFNALTLFQQRQLGRYVPAGAKLPIQTTCSRRGTTHNGPGDWVCTLTVFIPQPGAVPFQQTPVSYDLSVQSNGCFKAESPPSFVGQQTMRDANGRTVVNPLFTIYGCFNPL
jgi:ABC-2 type transport system permease protein